MWALPPSHYNMLLLRPYNLTCVKLVIIKEKIPSTTNQNGWLSQLGKPQSQTDLITMPVLTQGSFSHTQLYKFYTKPSFSALLPWGKEFFTELSLPAQVWRDTFDTFIPFSSQSWKLPVLLLWEKRKYSL